jgi:excisionase family DNA binding protein
VLTVRDLAELLRVDEKTIYRMAQRGELPGFKVSGSWRFEDADIRAWIESRKRMGARSMAGGEFRKTKRSF